jgi:hypothetical protein
LKNILQGIVYYTEKNPMVGNDKGGKNKKTKTFTGTGDVNRNGVGVIVNVDLTGNEALSLSNLVM